MLSANSLLNIRVAAFGLTGLVCLLYAAMAILTGRPDPISPWIPAAFGIVSAASVLVALMSAGKRSATMARDEGFSDDFRRAQGVGYWVALLLYPVFGFFLSSGGVEYHVAFAAMGTLTGAAFLLPFVWFDLKGRV